MIEIAPRITVDEQVRFGKPVIKGTRVPVDLIVAKLAAGMGFEEIEREYEIAKEDIYAVLDYAAKVLKDEEVKVLA